MRRVSRVQISLSACGIGDDVLDLGFAIARQREFGVTETKRLILDQHVLKFVRAITLILNLGAKTRHVRDRDLERFAVGVFSGPLPA